MREKCIVQGCNRDAQTNIGYCLLHYKRFKRTGDTELKVREKSKCLFCDNVSVARNLCNKHYQNWLRHGDAEYSDKIKQGNNIYGYKKSQGKYRVIHREIMSKAIGRDLTEKDFVHHINLDKQDNNIENLYLCNGSKHSKIHQQLNKIAGELVKKGIIGFSNGEYFITNNFS